MDDDYTRGLLEARRRYAQAFADGAQHEVHETDFTPERLRDELATLRMWGDERDKFGKWAGMELDEAHEENLALRAQLARYEAVVEAARELLKTLGHRHLSTVERECLRQLSVAASVALANQDGGEE